ARRHVGDVLGRVGLGVERHDPVGVHEAAAAVGVGDAVDRHAIGGAREEDVAQRGLLGLARVAVARVVAAAQAAIEQRALVGLAIAEHAISRAAVDAVLDAHLAGGADE